MFAVVGLTENALGAAGFAAFGVVEGARELADYLGVYFFGNGMGFGLFCLNTGDGGRGFIDGELHGVGSGF